MSYDRSNNLKRGGACLACRRRKIRCDGAQPVCGNCIDKNCADDCEYSDGSALTASQMYEENIRQLEARKRELEGASSSPRATVAIQLHHSSAHQGVAPAQEPSLDIAKRLVDAFMPFASELGFFLHPQRFKCSLARPAPAGDHSRPAPALLFVVYLWGIRLSGSAEVVAREPAFHTRAIQEATGNLSSGHPHQVIHGIQADVLLAYYYIAQEKYSEASYYVTSATTTALSANLHKIRSRHTVAQASEGEEPNALPPARDAVEEGERILAMWNVFILDKLLATATGQMPNFVNVSDRPDRRVDVPWPMSMGDYEQGHLAPNVRTDRTIDKFLNNERTSDGAHNSSMTMLAKAVFLWEKATDLAQQWNPALTQAQHASLTLEHKKTELLIERLKACIPPLNQFMALGNVEDVRKRVLWASILYATSIKLYEPALRLNGGDESSRNRAVMAAVGVMDATIATTGRGLGALNPFLAYTWVDSTRTITTQVTYLRGMRQPWEQPSDTEASLIRRLEKGLGAMKAFANLYPIMRSKVGEVQRMFESVSRV
ncbi:hypothetical protein NMY22_g3946 [Coprinellus aureogranulatus]|nr:hypothetical protein NMY22_g3946 [Coprinellus aureogranulatus]